MFVTKPQRAMECFYFSYRVLVSERPYKEEVLHFSKGRELRIYNGLNGISCNVNIKFIVTNYAILR